MAESYVTIGLLSISILELLVLQILHVSMLWISQQHTCLYTPDHKLAA